ncbi:MAG: metallophosphoesterase [Gemmatimonadetes bacterium]|nr:metallophosphoesterase [Gemmatimonadota bacterium]
MPAHVDAIERLVAERPFTAVIVSGDLTQRARAGEYQRAAVFLRDVERHAPVIAVPGNHDVRWWLAPMKVGREADLTDAWRRYLARPVEPVLRLHGATLVGLNTAQGITPRTLTWNMRDLSVIGDLRAAQLAWARQQFDAAPPGDLRVLVLHHNPVRGELSRRHGLKRAPEMMRAIAETGASVVCCGHDHQEAIHFVEHPRSGTIVSTAGTLSDRSRGGRPSACNVITVSADEIAVETLAWSHASLGFGTSHRQCFPR